MPPRSWPGGPARAEPQGRKRPVASYAGVHTYEWLVERLSARREASERNLGERAATKRSGDACPVDYSRRVAGILLGLGSIHRMCARQNPRRNPFTAEPRRPVHESAGWLLAGPNRPAAILG